LRLGFSSFVSGHILQSFRETYCSMFPGCEIKLTGGDPAHVLQRINQRAVDCAILPMPIENDNIRYDAAAKTIWIGYGSGAMAGLDLDGNNVALGSLATG
jgi:LysR substrate binding domain